MGVGAFVSRDDKPTMREMLASVGAKRELWEDLARFIDENYRVKNDLAFYGKNYGWAVRYRKSGKALLSLYPGKENFTVQIVVGETLARKASSLTLGENVRNVLENARQFPEGRWLFIRIGSRRDLSDVKRLLALKTQPANRN